MISSGARQSIRVASLALAFILAAGVISYLLLGVLGTETRWLVYLLLATVMGLIFFAVPDKQKFLWIALVFSFQFDLAIRPFFGRAGSGGIYIGLPMFIAASLLLWIFIFEPAIARRKLDYGGRLKWPIWTLIAVTTISGVLSTEQFVSLTSLARLLQYYLFYLIALNFIDTAEKLELTIKVCLFVIAVQSIIYFLQVSLGITFTMTGDVIDAVGRSSASARPGGTVSTNPAGYASFMLPLLCIAFSLLLWVRFNLGSCLRIGLPLLFGIIAIVLTLTRAAWGSMLIGFVAVAVLAFRSGRLSTGKMLALAVVATIGLAASIPLINERMADAPLDASFDERSTLMEIAVEVIKAEPWFGVGPGAYRQTLVDYLPYQYFHFWRAPVHNHFLLRTAETGLVGGLAFITLLLFACHQSYRVTKYGHGISRTYGIGIFGALMALAFEMFWDIWGGYTYSALLWFLLGVSGATERMVMKDRPPDTSSLNESTQPTGRIS